MVVVVSAYPLLLNVRLGPCKAPCARAAVSLPTADVLLLAGHLCSAGADQLESVEPHLVVSVVPDLGVESHNVLVVRAVSGSAPLSPVCFQVDDW